VNLVGILFESGKQRFEAVQAEGAAAVAKAAAGNRAQLVQFSAIGADPESKSAYARSKAEGEAAAFMADSGAIVFRPSIVFGPEDDFFNKFAALARFLPALPLIGGGKTRFQPVFVGDVAEAVDAALAGRARRGAIYELGGPEIRTFEELMQLTLREIGRKRLLVPIPFGLAKLQAFFMEFMPKPLLTRDQVTLLHYDNVVSPEADRQGYSLRGLGITPTAMETVLPTYLVRFRRAGQFSRSFA
jgi:NADH dehydrogenase